MTREEELQQAVDNFSEAHKYEGGLDYLSMGIAFEEGVEWADQHPKSPWISTKEKLPYNDSNFIHFGFTNRVLVRNKNRDLFVAYMKKNKDNEWIWCSDTDDNFDLLSCVTHWMYIPKISKE